MGVFQILLRNRATNLNAKMHDGTTPLILAARLAIEGMVEDLINADADINAADNAGKTALHWAAAVNNVDAVNILLSHGANRDAQDEKDETPLFLAAREGSHEACRALLDNFANREITDHMDRLPRDVAQERLHNDIVRLLDEHVPRSPQMIAVMPNSAAMGGLTSPTMLSHPTVINTKVRGSKKQRATKSPTSPDSGDQPPRRKASTKKKKQPEPIRSVESAASSLSPIGSLESPHNHGEVPSPYDGKFNFQSTKSCLKIKPRRLQNSNLVFGKKYTIFTKFSRSHSTVELMGVEFVFLGVTQSYTAGITLLHGLELQGLPIGSKLPPSYEECLKSGTASLHQMDSYYSMPSQQTHQMLHQRQSSTLSPPHSASSVAMSPPSSSYVGSPSPSKIRPNLPTSPTHMQAMRTAQQQKQMQVRIAHI